MTINEILQAFPAFLLIFVRAVSFFVTVPIFSYRNVPALMKIGLAFFLALIMYFTLQPDGIKINEMFLLLVFKEALVGLSIGLIAMILIYAIQMAGGFIDQQMGFAIANIVDPQTGIQSPLIGKYMYNFSIILLLAMNAHYMLIDGIVYSYQWIPLQDWLIPFGSGGVAKLATKTLGTMFVIAFQMAIPVVGSLFLVDIALGIVARTVPQVNVFIVGMPLKILIGFMVLMIILPVFMMLVQQLFEEMVTAMRDLMQLLGGG